MIHDTVQKMKFSIRDFFSKCDHVRSFLLTGSHLLKKSLTENFVFCALNNARFQKKEEGGYQIIFNNILLV